MKTIFRSAKTVAEQVLAPVAARPLLSRSLQLLFAVTLYAAGVWAVDVVAGDSRAVVIVFAVYFLPAVLRAWVQFYWCLRDELKALMRPRNKTGKAL